MGLPTGTVTFLTTDVEGSTRARERCGGAAELARHAELVTRAIVSHGGASLEDGTGGDGVLAVFPRSADA